ncbi:hypothetical protein [Amycolatopsis sp. NPDC051102]|uniref:hypothetical protein n=1 Tax=Amycolatopsis sp. NPDC051102 TaxID=3155163 RepID=UPI00344345D1
MTDHNGHIHSTRVWVVYSLPEPPQPPIPLVLWTMPVRPDDNQPCRQCHRIGREGPCPGSRAHAYAQHARLSLATSIRPLKVDVFELPPHVSVLMCATHLYALIVKRAKEDGPPAAGEADEQS